MLLIRQYLYPLLHEPPLSVALADQFAFRLQGLPILQLLHHVIIYIIVHHVTTILADEPYVQIVALDFSRAFDVVRHGTLFDKLCFLPLPDSIYN